jgi:hypothetical protein
MKRILLTCLIAAATLGLSAGNAAAANTFHSTFRGSQVTAYFFSVDPSGCIVTDAYVSAVDGRIKTEGSPTADSTAWVGVSMYDSCTGTLLSSASGSAVLASDALQIDPKLESATLNASIEAFDWLSGSPITLDVELTWTGSGEVTSSKYHQQYTSPGYRVHSRGDGSFRAASAVGSISNGSVEFASAPSLYGDLSSVKSGYIEISH